MLIDGVQRVGFVAGSSASMMAVAAIPPEHASTIAVVVAAVGVIAAGIAWIDSRVDKRITTHERAEFDKQAARDQLDGERHRGLLSEIRHVKDLIDIRGELKAMRARLMDPERRVDDPRGEVEP